MQPGLEVRLVHADWSVDPKKRWLASACWHDGACRIDAVEPVGDLATRWTQWSDAAAATLVGFDLPIGLPRSYLALRKIPTFRAFLAQALAGGAADFFEVAEAAAEISPRRPFYPLRAGPRGTVKRDHLAQGIGLPLDALMRACDRRAGAECLFFTLGPRSVGKAALTMWHELLLPTLERETPPRLWPFDGGLADLLAPGRVVFAECWPTLSARRLGLVGPGRSKRSASDRAAMAAVLIDALQAREVDMAPAVRDALLAGLPFGRSGEDAFDALLGLWGMIAVLRGEIGEMQSGLAQELREAEGWMLGLDDAAINR